MSTVETRLLDALRCSIHGRPVQWTEPVPPAEQRNLVRLASIHNVLPLVVEAIYGSGSLVPARTVTWMRELARNQTVYQAQRTAEFLLLYEELERRGIQPTVIKGIVCRSLYPQPEQRSSLDEDVFVSEANFPRLHEALVSCGLYVEGNPTPDADEVTYRNDERLLFLEVHRHLFFTDSDAYSDCNVPFSESLEHTVTVQVEGVSLRTLAPTDHLLFLICHAYKHFLHGGVGIRQICDMGLFAQQYGGELDWDHIVSTCQELHVDKFAAALFRIGETHLGFSMPEVFAAHDVDTAPLLKDILSGGVYGAEDIDRHHSSTLTLDAVAADRTGKRRGGALHSIFLPARDLSGRYTYLRRRPWLLPVAWTQRIWGYLAKRREINPTSTLRIGKERIALLRQYGIIN